MKWRWGFIGGGRLFLPLIDPYVADCWGLRGVSWIVSGVSPRQSSMYMDARLRYIGGKLLTISMGCQQNIYIPKELWQQFGDYAETQKVSRSYLLRQVICAYLQTEDPTRYQECDGEHTHQKITDRAVEKILKKARGD